MSTEPCGSLPVTNWDVSVSYCHHHMAWHARCATWHQTSDEDLRVIHTEHATFGPFDSWDDVAAWVQERLYDPSVAPA
jgi:hypothetical protein